MIPSDPRLLQRVIGWHAAFTLATASLVALLGPELLLLREAQVLPAMGSLFIAVLLGGGLGTLRNYRSLLRHEPLIRTLTLGSRTVEPSKIKSLSNELWRSVAGWATPSVATLGLSALAWRPPIIDLKTGLSLALLGVGIVAAATLPFYVLVRSAFARMFGIVPADVMRDVLENAEFKHLPQGRLLRQLLAAVVTWLVLFYRDILSTHRPAGGDELLIFGMMPVVFIFGAAAIALVGVSLATQPPRQETVEKFFPKP